MRVDDITREEAIGEVCVVLVFAELRLVDDGLEGRLEVALDNTMDREVDVVVGEGEGMTGPIGPMGIEIIIPAIDEVDVLDDTVREDPDTWLEVVGLALEARL